MLIQGIGDEVISVIITLIVVGIISLVWLSTHVQDRPLVRAVVIRSSNNPNEVQEIQIANNSSNSSPPPDENELREAIEATESSLETPQQNVGRVETSFLTSNNGKKHHKLLYSLCSRNHQNVKLRLHGVGILKFYCYADFS